MTLSSTQLLALMEAAVDAAQSAGAHIASHRPQHIEHKPAGTSEASQVVTELDRQAQGIIVARLAASTERLGLGLLAEETPDDGSRHRSDFFWCIDPLDGTLPFVEGLPGYSCSVGLVARDGTPQVGAVFDPVAGTTLHAARGEGLFRDGRRWQPLDEQSGPHDASVSVFADRSFMHWPGYRRVLAALEAVAPRLGLRGVRVVADGAAVINACRVLADPPACFFKLAKPQPGGGSLWDYAATACLFAEAGAVATDEHGAALDLNRRGSTFMNHRGVVFATSPTLAEAIYEIAADQRSPSMT